MKIKTQFIITMVLFCIILAGMVASAIITNQRLENAGRLETIAGNIAQGASELGYLAQDYLIYRETQQLRRWQSRFASFSAHVAGLRATRPEHRVLVSNIQANQKRLKEVFDSVTFAFGNKSRNQSAILDSAALQVSWSRMAVQTQGLISDASRLSQLLHQQMDRLTRTRTLQMYIMMVLFGAFLLSGYVFTYRRILKSIAVLRAGAAVIGSGNLDFNIEEKRNDEIGDLSRAFNRMTADLKSVTAFKAELEKEVKDRERAEAELARTARQRQIALDAAHMGWWHYDPVTRIAYWDDRYKEIFGVTGYSRPNDEILAQIIHQEDLPGLWAKVEAALNPVNPQPFAAEYRIHRPDGLMRWIEAHGIASFEGEGENQRATSFVGTVADITDRKRAEEAIRASLVEKEVLLKEIHHRVKNNMQVISSLVALQADESEDAVIRDVLKDVSHRVRSMAMVHEKLYQSADLAKVDFAEYAQSLLSYLWRSYGSEASGVRLALDLEPVSLSVNQAVPCGLILNELISNALKHAFPRHGEGEVAVSLRSGEQGEVVLRVHDSGRGLPAGFDWNRARSLGLRLVQMLAGQLHAAVEVSCDGGTEFNLIFGRPNI